jgi:hypothetical protein
MKYLRWIQIEDYAIKYRAYIEEETADIVEDESIEPKNQVITIEGKSVDITEDESIDPKKINPIITVEDESIDPETHRVLYKRTNNNPKKTNPVIRKNKSIEPKKTKPLSRRK